MSKQYRHKRTGNIATAPLKTVYGVFKAGRQIVGCPDEHIPKWLVEDSNDWELIEEPKKDYEILKYHTKYRMEHRTTEEIHSVKRLSDGVVFTVGDVVTHHISPLDNGIIKSFEVKDYGILIHYYGKYKDDNNYHFVNTIPVLKHVKKPLFTTEDGFEIFKGDCYWFLFVERRGLIEPYLLKYAVSNGVFREDDEFIRTFSTKGAAERYILRNKPCLSLNNVANVYGDVATLGSPLYSRLMSGLKQLVKSRL